VLFKRELRETLALIDRMLLALQAGIPTRGTTGAELRRVVGNFQAHEVELVENFTIGTQLFNCFEQARLAGATLDTMDGVLKTMLAERPLFYFGRSIKLAGMIFSFVEQATLISKMTFFSRSDAEAMLIRMSKVIETLKLEVAELLDGIDYRSLTALAATLTQHLAVTERKLPFVVNYNMIKPETALSLANLFYGDGGRFDELIAENHVINPAFFPLDIHALSQ
jgi:hypothetical protein